MLERQSFSNGVVAYISPLLEQIGVRHAFSTRLGGISPPPFDSMNLGNPNGAGVQDDYQRVWENYRKLQETVGLASDQKPCRVHQVHGNVVVRVMREERFNTDAKADAIVSDDPSRVISVRVADCVPVLLSSGDGRTVAAVHAGWRGVVAGVVTQALREMQIDPADCIAAIGPCIGIDAFEVGPEVVAEFQAVFGSEAPYRMRADGKGHVDLRTAISIQLTQAGMPTEQIDCTDRCTHRDADEFFSHRRENGITGRMAALIQSKK